MKIKHWGELEPVTMKVLQVCFLIKTYLKVSLVKTLIKYLISCQSIRMHCSQPCFDYQTLAVTTDTPGCSQTVGKLRYIFIFPYARCSLRATSSHPFSWEVKSIMGSQGSQSDYTLLSMLLECLYSWMQPQKSYWHVLWYVSYVELQVRQRNNPQSSESSRLD